MILLTGTRLDRYEILSPLGAGGMGEVYLARDTRLKRSVALKVLRPELIGSKEHLNRFKREAYAVSALNHPNILTIHEIGLADSTHFIATEFVEGVTLRQHMESLRHAHTRMRVEEVLEVAVQVTKALTAAHDAQIVHRDIKPENIMLRRDGYVKVLDFGLAKLVENLYDHAVDHEASTLPDAATAPGRIFGTINYMSPEQLRGIPVDTRTDIWSLGVVVYEMIAGRSPFESGASKEVTIVSILERDPVPLQHLAEVPEELERVVRKALAKDRDRRYQTAKDLLTDLQNIRRELELKVASGSSGRDYKGDAAEPPAQQDSVAAETAPQEGACRTLGTNTSVTGLQPSALKVLLALLILFGVSFGLYKVFRPPEPPPPRIPFENPRLAQIPYTDKAVRVAISPDGRYVAQVDEDNGLRSIWLRQVGDDEMDQPPRRIVPPLKSRYFGLIFSPDSNYIYYVEQRDPLNFLYRMHVQERVPVKVLEDIDSTATFSPDGGRIAFQRHYPHEAADAVMIADADDGGDERKLLTRKRPEFLTNGGFAWSPDGRVIVCGSGSYASGGYLGVIAVRADDGREEALTPMRWWTVGRIAWLGDGSGLIMTAAERGAGGTNDQVWHVPYPSGEPRQVTNELSDYNWVSLTKTGKTAVAMRSTTISDVWVAPEGEADRAKKITTNWAGWGTSWTPDGKILFVSNVSGNEDVWIMNPDGTGQERLTDDPGFDYSPAASPDGRHVVFVSHRAGSPNIWRVGPDGNDLRRLTSGTGEYTPRCTADGRWVIYTSDASGKRTSWRVSIDGGEPVQLIDKPTNWPVPSPDGKWVACNYSEDQQTAPWVIAVVPAEGGEPVRKFDDLSGHLIRWSPDGRYLTYIKTEAGISNIWSKPLEGGKPKKLTDFKDLQIYSFDWSYDGNMLACERGSTTWNAVYIRDVN